MFLILFGRHSVRTGGSRPLRRGLRKWLRGIERLEDRLLLATFTVNSLIDSVDANPGDGFARDAAGLTTLRAAVMEANALAGNDAINLPAGTYMLTLAGHNEDMAATGDLDVAAKGTLTILGAGASASIVDAAGLGEVGDRVFHVLTAARLNISGLVIRKGSVVKAPIGPPPNPPLGHVVSDGGGILNAGTLTISNSIVSENAARDFGAGIYNAAGATLTISDSAITGNRGGNDPLAGGIGRGGGISNSGALTIINCTLSTNVAGSSGGGIDNSDSGTVTIVGSTIMGNRSGGGFSNGRGGGVYNLGTLIINSSTISGNTATGGNAGDSTGGGVYCGSGTVTINNSTVSGNSATHAGAVYNNAAMTIKSSTITDNFALTRFGSLWRSGQPGGVLNSGTGALTIQNTIVAGNRVTTDFPSSTDVSGAFNSLGNNLIGDTFGSSGWIASDLKGTPGSPLNPRLGQLADNGGPTLTHALLPDSPAIDAGNNTGAPGTDQRGIRRPRDGNGDSIAVVDVGAFELSLEQTEIETVHDNANVNEDTTNNIIGVLANDTGPPGRTLTVAAVTQPMYGTAAVGPNGAHVLYSPNANFSGVDTFAYTVTDGMGGAATAMVTVTVANVDTDFQGTAGDDVYLVRRDSSRANVQVFANDTGEGAPIFSQSLASLGFLLFETLAGNDRLIVDSVNGDPLPSGGIQFLGGGNSTAGDRLIVRSDGAGNGAYVPGAMTAGDGVVTIGGRNVTLTGVEPIELSDFNTFTVITPNANDVLSIASPAAGATQLTGTSGGVSLSPMSFPDVGTFIIDAAAHDGGAGDDSLTISASGVAPGGFGFLQYRSGTGANTLTIEAGTARIDSTAAAGGILNTSVAMAGQLITHRLRQTELTLAGGSRATILPDGTDAATSVLNSLSINTGATLDINDNVLILDYTVTSPVAAVRAKILEGRGGAGIGNGNWTGTGITSGSAAQANATAPDSRSVGYAENSLLPLGAYTTFRGLPVDATSILIAYTRTGDANLDGLVNDDDVTIVGATYAPGVSQPHWALGDLDYNGFVDADDVTLLGALYDPAAVRPAPPVSDAAVSGEWLSPPVAESSLVVARSPDRATATTEGLPPAHANKQTFGPRVVRGRETRAQPARETRAQPPTAHEVVWSDDSLNRRPTVLRRLQRSVDRLF